MRGPCLCGAPDCRKCFPGNFDDAGTYKFRERECEECECDFVPVDGATLCDECQKKREQAR